MRAAHTKTPTSESGQLLSGYLQSEMASEPLCVWKAPVSSSTSTWTSSHPNENNRETGSTQFQKCDVLFSKSSSYLVMDFNGEGCFGKVAKCLDLTTFKTVAVKIHKRNKEHLIRREVQMLKAIRALDPEKKHIVRFMDHFTFHNVSCLAFEMLDRSLWDLMRDREGMSLSLNEIRPVTQQLLVAFDALKSIGILHTDLKPDNIMLVNHKDQPFRVKLIDFGLALPLSKVHVGMTIQACAYRAPEVMLGLPLSEAVDMWGVGCVMAFLYFGVNLFPGTCAYRNMKAMVHLLGQPEDHLLRAGINTWQYFRREEGSSSPGWRLNSPEEYKEATGLSPEAWPTLFVLSRNLEDAVLRCTEKVDAFQYQDRMAFISLLKSCLHLDAGRRITPRKALKNPFITMAHLEVERDISSYVDEAVQFMTISSLDHDEPDDTLINTETDMELRDLPLTSNSSDEFPDTNSSHEESDSECCRGTNADIESACVKFSDTERSTGGDSDTENSSDEDNVEPATWDSYDRDSLSSFSDGHDVQPASSLSCGGDSHTLSSSDEDDKEVSAPTGLENRSTTHGFREEDSPLESSGLELSEGEFFSFDISPGSSSASAAVCTDVAAATIFSHDRAAAAITPFNAGDVKRRRRRKKNLFKKIYKFLQRAGAKMVSIFIFGENEAAFTAP